MGYLLIGGFCYEGKLLGGSRGLSKQVNNGDKWGYNVGYRGS